MKRRDFIPSLAAGALVAGVGSPVAAKAVDQPALRRGTRLVATFDSPVTAIMIYKIIHIVVACENAVYFVDPPSSEEW